MFKKRIWHAWVDEVVEIGEQIHNRGLVSKLVTYCEDHKRSQSTLYIPQPTAVSYYFKFSDKFKEVGTLDGKKLWERVK